MVGAVSLFVDVEGLDIVLVDFLDLKTRGEGDLDTGVDASMLELLFAFIEE
jgi:hypothetical protein